MASAVTKKWPNNLIEAQCGCCGLLKLPNHHHHDSLPIMAELFPFPLLSCVISACRPEKRPSMESCQDSSVLEKELCEFMPKKPNFEFELLKCNKAAYFPSSLLSLCPKPLADVEVFRNVSLFSLSWENGSQHSFSRKPQELFQN